MTEKDFFRAKCTLWLSVWLDKDFHVCTRLFPSCWATITFISGLHAATFLWSCYDAASTVTFLVKSFFCHCWRILAKLGKLGRKLQKGREMMWDVRPHAARRPWVIFYTSIDLRQCLLGDFTEVLFLQLVHLIAPQRKIRLWSGSERSLKLPIWLKSWS